MQMDPFIAPILSALSSALPESAWCAFLDRYSGLIYHVFRSFDRDPDRSGNCFLFVCEQLSASDFRRLRKFEHGGNWQERSVVWLAGVRRVGKTFLCQSLADSSALRPKWVRKHVM